MIMRRITSTYWMVLCLLLSACSALQLGLDENQPVRKITPFGANSSGPFWTASGNDLIASHLVYPKYVSQIYRFDSNGRNKELLLETTGAVDAQAVSADGNELLFASFGNDDFERGIWIIDLTQKESRFISPGDSASWSPDEQDSAAMAAQTPAVPVRCAAAGPRNHPIGWH
jgi:hypothetical protein